MILFFWLSPGKKSIKKTFKEWKHLLKLNVTFLILKIVYEQSHSIVTVPKDTIINRVLFIEHYMKLNG